MHYKIIPILILGISIYTTKSTYAQQEKSSLEHFIEKKRNYNKTSKKGYGILLYSGNEKKALATYDSFKEEYPDIEIKLSYVSPNWKVTSKIYSTKIEAERVYLIIKDKQVNAKIL